MNCLRKLETRFARIILLVSSCLLLLGIILTALLHPRFGWDVWWYHLPFSGLLHNVNDFRDKFEFYGHFAERYKGFPKLMNWIGGLLWKSTNSLGGLALPNALSIAVYIAACWFLVGLHIEIILPLILCVPLIAVHSVSGYTDLPANIAIAIQILSGVILIQRDSIYKKKNIVALLAYLLSALVAGNIKYPCTIVSLFIGVILAGILLYRRFPSWRRRLCILIAGIILSSSTLMHNTIAFGNPFYPIRLGGLPGVEDTAEEVSSPTYTKFLGPFKKPVDWILSVTEIDWKIRGVKPGYNENMSAGDLSIRGGEGRTGGYGGGLIITNLFIFSWLVFRLRRKQGSEILKDLVAIFLMLTFLNAFLPHNIKLRFYLYWPILLLTINAYGLSKWVWPREANRLAILSWIIFCVWSLQHRDIFPIRHLLKDTPSPLESLRLDPKIKDRIKNAYQKGESRICFSDDETEDKIAHRPMTSAYALLYGSKNLKIIQGTPSCPPGLNKD